MDLKQRKLNKSEWESIEIPVNESEMNVLNLIVRGFHDVSVRINHNHSIFTFLKIEYTEKVEDFVYNKFLRSRATHIETLLKTLVPSYKPMKIDANVKLNSGDRIRLERFDETTILQNDVYEFVLLTHLEKMVTSFKSWKTAKNGAEFAPAFHYHYYTLYKLMHNSIARVNRHVVALANTALHSFSEEVQTGVILKHAVEFIEKNESLLKYCDMTLYEHQKEIFNAIKQPRPQLIMYMAPTGTGKTLTPIALSEHKKIIFVCAARHVGLALARAAISVKKRVAFAFGCASADDIRLHYFAAKEFTRNKRTGAIRKVDNSVGDNVEIMVSDIKSYLPAMYYMISHFGADNIVTYWDEPTITMDYVEHDFHKTIRKNWKENNIPVMVLSSATLPKEHELTQTIPDFLNKFHGAEICNIVSHDCKKSIPIVNKDGFVVLPHYLCENYEDMKKMADHCGDYLTLLRYFDLKEVVEFISYVHDRGLAGNKMRLERHFEDLDAIHMKSIKMYYVEMLKHMAPDVWREVYAHFMESRKPRILENSSVDTRGNRIHKVHSLGPGVTTANHSGSLQGTQLVRLASEQMPRPSAPKQATSIGTSGVYVTTKDAYTLTDGPTIFITDDIDKVVRFCVQQANIPPVLMEELMKKIEFNNVINERLYEVETQMDTIKEEIENRVKNDVNVKDKGVAVKGRTKSGKDANLKKLGRDLPEEVMSRGALHKMAEEANQLRAMIKRASLNDAFVPNKKAHLDKWAPENHDHAFTSVIDEHVVADIMALKGVDDRRKIMLMMGVGVFDQHENIAYTEIMKKLADEQRLFLILATSDYIFGTNYQFCHGFLSKDLNLTQEKIIQAMGRIGRNNIQQTYTVRFRDDAQIAKLFTCDTAKPEVINMNVLFNCTRVKYEDGTYVEVPEEEEPDLDLEGDDNDQPVFDDDEEEEENTQNKHKKKNNDEDEEEDD